MNNNEKYDDIINMPHHVSKKHPQMSIEMRLAQFAPFAALTGYEEAVKETGRLTSKRIDIDEELKVILNEKLKIIQKKIYSNFEYPEIECTYFMPDLIKEGGKYITVIGNAKKINKYKNIIVLQHKIRNEEEKKNCTEIEILIKDIIDIKIK